MSKHWPVIAVRALARYLRPWLDRRTNRPLVLLAAVATMVLVAPLAVDVAGALWGRLPSRVRWWTGELTFVGSLAGGLWRLWLVRETDAWPSNSNTKAPRSPASSWVPWALRLAVISLVAPIMTNPNGLGFADWDFELDKFEALRRTIMEWGQFPWWNPWCRGGFPLAAEPQIGAVWIATPLVLALGTGIGLRISAILCMLIAIEGAYWLAWHWLREPFAAGAAALTYALNGAVSVDTADGYIIVMSYCCLPWLAYCAFRIGDGLRYGLGLGGWMAFAVMNGIQYLSWYGGLLSAVIWIRAFRVQPRDTRSRLLAHTLAALGFFFAVCGWRLAIVLLVLLDDKREYLTNWNESPLSFIGSLLTRPRPNWPSVIPGHGWSYYTELISYVGAGVVLFAVLSVGRGWRWWHTLTLVCGALALGSTQWYHPSYWTRNWPLFSSAHVVTRWRFVAFLGMGMAAGSFVAEQRRSQRRIQRILAALLVVAIGADFVVLAHEQLPWAFSILPEPDQFPGPPVSEFVNVRHGLGYPAVMRGYGLIEGYEPMLGYFRDAPTLRRARDDSDYQGEAWTAEGRVSPVYWSPNLLVFQVRPGQEVFMNQNPGSWWWANGRQAFPGRACAELMLPFVARADETGRLELRIHPRGLSFGIGLELFGVVALGAALRICRRQYVTHKPGALLEIGRRAGQVENQGTRLDQN